MEEFIARHQGRRQVSVWHKARSHPRRSELSWPSDFTVGAATWRGRRASNLTTDKEFPQPSIPSDNRPAKAVRQTKKLRTGAGQRSRRTAAGRGRRDAFQRGPTHETAGGIRTVLHFEWGREI